MRQHRHLQPPQQRRDDIQHDRVRPRLRSTYGLRLDRLPRLRQCGSQRIKVRDHLLARVQDEQREQPQHHDDILDLVQLPQQMKAGAERLPARSAVRGRRVLQGSRALPRGRERVYDRGSSLGQQHLP